MKLSREEIIEAENVLIEAIKCSNISILDKLLHDDLLFIAPDGKVITKAIDLDSHRSGTMVVETVDVNIEQINIIGDTAVVVVDYDTKGKMLGNPIEGKFRYIRIWKKFEDGCKVAGGSCFLLQNS
jgi:hypothetical protein